MRHRPFHWNRTAIAASLLLALATREAPGTTLVKRSFDDLCQRADVVFIGTVSTVESRRDADGNAIHTFTTFTDIEWVVAPDAGGAGDTYTLRTLGGIAGGERLVVGAMPRFDIGRRYALFVRGNNERACPVVGWQQGCFRVTGGDSGREPRVETYTGRRVVSIAGADVISLSETAPQARGLPPMTPDEFVEHIRSRIQGISPTESEKP